MDPITVDGNLNPVVTLCVATFESEAYIESILQSVCQQTYPHLKCIISDDGSSDRTIELCTKIANGDSRFVFESHPERLGWIGNMNRILKQDLGDYFVFVSHDDELKPRFLETLLRVMSENDDASVVFSDAEEYVGEASHYNVLHYEESLGDVSNVERCRPIAIRRPFCHWFLAYHGLVRNRLLKVDRRLRYNLAGEFTADKIWTLGLAISGQFIRVPEVLWKKDSSQESVSAKWKHSLRAIAAVQLSGSRLICSSDLPIWQRIQIIFYLFLGWVRALKGKLQTMFSKSKS